MCFSDLTDGSHRAQLKVWKRGGGCSYFISSDKKNVLNKSRFPSFSIELPSEMYHWFSKTASLDDVMLLLIDADGDLWPLSKLLRTVSGGSKRASAYWSLAAACAFAALLLPHCFTCLQVLVCKRTLYISIPHLFLSASSRFPLFHGNKINFTVSHYNEAADSL